MAESRATDMIGEIAERGARPGRIRRFFQAVKRNLFPPEPMPGRGGLLARGDIYLGNFDANGDFLGYYKSLIEGDEFQFTPGELAIVPPHRIPDGETVTLPRHQVVMLRHGFAELLKWAISERDCFFQCNTDAEGNVLDREDRITLDEMDAEIDRAQYALRDFDRVYPNGS